eukprot:g57955.t1
MNCQIQKMFKVKKYDFYLRQLFPAEVFAESLFGHALESQLLAEELIAYVPNADLTISLVSNDNGRTEIGIGQLGWIYSRQKLQQMFICISGRK